MTWEEEYNMFLTEYGFDALADKDYIDKDGFTANSEPDGKVKD
jgi:hypothetical protein